MTTPSSATRDKLRSTLQRLAPSQSASSGFDDEHAHAAAAEAAGNESEEPLTEDINDLEVEEDNDADADVDEEKRHDHNGGRPPSPSPRSSDATYAQYISKNRSRYSYSPTPRSPRSPHTPSAQSSKRPLSPVQQHRPASRNQLEPPSPSSPAAAPRRPSHMSITISDSHTAEVAQSPHSSTSPLAPSHTSPTKRTRVRSHSALSSPSPSPSSPSVASLHVALAKAQSVIAERENDIKLAAQIGEMIMEENEKMEKLMSEMRLDMAEREERELHTKEEVKKLHHTIDQLRKQNIHLASTHQQPNSHSSTPSINAALPGSDAPPSVKTPSSSGSLQDFLRQELSTTQSAAGPASAAEQYTGDVSVDLRSFIRRLHAERRNAAVVVGTLRETVARLEEEKGEKERELEKSADAIRALREREEAMSKEMTELRDRRRAEEIESMNERQRELMSMKKSQERVIAELEHELREEREERESQQKMRREAEDTIQDMRQRMEALRREADEQRAAAPQGRQGLGGRRSGGEEEEEGHSQARALGHRVGVVLRPAVHIRLSHALQPAD